MSAQAVRKALIPNDMHIHSTCSVDGRSTITEYAKRALELGMVEVGFCEHIDFDPRDLDYGYLSLKRYDQELALAKAEVSELGMRQGIEIPYQHCREDEIGDWLSARSWDFVVASVHLVDYADGWAIISEPCTSKVYFSTHNYREAYEAYFQELLLAAGSGLGDILGHFDLIKRHGSAYYGSFDPQPFRELIHAVLEKAVEKGLGLEINTSGWRQAPRESYPNLEILRWYRQLGGEILTIGSDAHHISDLGAGSSRALALAREAGFRAIATFEKRKIRWIDL